MNSSETRITMLSTCDMCDGSGKMRTEAEDELGNHIEHGECMACDGQGFKPVHVPVEEFVRHLRVVMVHCEGDSPVVSELPVKWDPSTGT
jgi:DnaJ-class molecular chaperone